MVSFHRFAIMLTILGGFILPRAGWADESAGIHAVKKLGGQVFVAEKSPGKPVVRVAFYGNNKSIDAALKAVCEFKKLEALIIRDNLDISEAGMKEVKKLKSLRTLGLAGSKVTDMDLKYIMELSNLQYLDISGTQVTDAGLKEMKNFKDMKSLILVGLKITNAGLKELKGSDNLELLDLRGTQITDDGLAELTALNNLRELLLNETKVTEAGVKGLQAASPKVLITR